MSDPLFLMRNELIDLTGKKLRRAQVEALRSMGIAHKVRPDGRVMVSRKHVDQTFGVMPHVGSLTEIEPNWDAA